MWYNLPENLVQLGEKKLKIRASTALRVIEVGTNGKPVYDFLLVINSYWHPISCRFGVIAAYCSNFGYFVFLSHPLGELRDNVRYSSWAHWKALSGHYYFFRYMLRLSRYERKRDRKLAIIKFFYNMGLKINYLIYCYIVLVIKN